MKDAYYFSHDSNASNDEKCLFIISKYGLVAYGLYWALVEAMYNQTDGKLTCKLLDGYAMSLNIDITLLKQIYNDFITINLFITDGEKYWSERVLRNKNIRDEKRSQRSLAGIKGMQSRWGKTLENTWVDNTPITDLITNDNDTNNKNNKVKERKGKESIYKTPYAEDVFLQESEYQTLVEKYGEDNAKAMILKLNSYKQAHGKKYKSDYGAINSWVAEEIMKKIRGKPPDDQPKPQIAW